MAIGALALAGCTNDDAAYAKFCETSQSLSAMTAQSNQLVPNQEELNSAGAGDFAALNAWGTQAQGAVADIGTKFQEALDEAPDEDVAGALATYLAMLDVFQQMAVAGAEADSIEGFSATLQDLNQQGTDLTADMDAAGQVLATTEQAHCK